MKIFYHFIILLSFSIFSLNSISQIQIGNDIMGVAGGNQFGTSVGINSFGNVIVAGAPLNTENGNLSGQVRIFEYNTTSNTWVQKGQAINGESSLDNSGIAVALNGEGSIVAIGAQGNDGNGNNSGHVRVFIFNETLNLWDQLGGDINGESMGDQSGRALDINSEGNIVAIGAWLNDGNGNNSGQARIFEFNSDINEWEQLGQDINGETAGEMSGFAISLNENGNTVAVGAPFNDDLGTFGGQVRIYNYDQSSSNWIQIGQDINGPQDDQLGSSLDLNNSGNTIVIGSPSAGGNFNGQAIVFNFSNDLDQWEQIGNEIEGQFDNGFFGFSVGINSNGNVIYVGSTDQSNGNPGQVRSFVFDSSSNSWELLGEVINGNSSGDQFGFSIDIARNNNAIIIGAPQNNSGDGSAGEISVYDYTAILNIEDLNANERVLIYPNPTNGFVEILANSMNISDVVIHDINGRIIKSYPINESKYKLDISDLKNGIYFLEFLSENNKIVKRILKY